MIQKTITLIIISVIIIAGCNQTDEPESKEIMVDSVFEEKEPVDEDYADSATLDDDVKDAYNTCIQFIGWYNKNYEMLDQDNLVAYSDSLGYYVLNREHADFYVAQFKQTNLFTERFLDDLRGEFKSYGEYFEEEKITKDTDGPIGYEYDIIYNSQDANYSVDLSENLLNKYTLAENETEIEISIKYFGYVTLVKNKEGEWIIDELLFMS